MILFKKKLYENEYLSQKKLRGCLMWGWIESKLRNEKENSECIQIKPL